MAGPMKRSFRAREQDRPRIDAARHKLHVNHGARRAWRELSEARRDHEWHPTPSGWITVGEAAERLLDHLVVEVDGQR